ncbi:MAG: isochorismatase family protein [Acidimicrobiales bacterium]|nr:isochorismatase family protein [Acidimicrobiales bacterium]
MAANPMTTTPPPVGGPDAGATFVAGTEPYPWPYDGALAPGHLALVLAGWDDSWSTRAHDPAAARAACLELALAVEAYGGLVLSVAHGPASDPSSGPALPVEAIAVVAAGVDAFHGSPLDALLRRAGRTHLLVAGFGLEGPVHSTLRSANDRGYECLLVTDASAPLVPELAAPAAHTVTMSGGIFGAVGSAAAVLAALDPPR